MTTSPPPPSSDPPTDIRTGGPPLAAFAVPWWGTAINLTVTILLVFLIFHGSQSIIGEKLHEIWKAVQAVWITDAPWWLRFAASATLCAFVVEIGTIAFFIYEYLNPWVHEMFEGRGFFIIRSRAPHFNPVIANLLERDRGVQHGKIIGLFLVLDILGYIGIARLPKISHLINTVVRTLPALHDCTATIVYHSGRSATYRVHIDATNALWADRPSVEMTFLYADGHEVSDIVRHRQAILTVPLYGSPVTATRCGVALLFTHHSKRPSYVAPWIPYGDTTPGHELPPVSEISSDEAPSR